jgi:tetratricopeptide (TPR) repeat protein
MPRQFNCPFCDSSIITFLRVGETAQCGECEATAVIPENADETARRPDWATGIDEEPLVELDDVDDELLDFEEVPNHHEDYYELRDFEVAEATLDESAWPAGAVGLLFCVLTFGVVFAISILRSPNQVRIGNIEIEYSGEATIEDARKLARFFHDEEAASSEGANVRIHATSTRYTLSLIPMEDASVDDLEFIDGFREFGGDLIESGFPKPLSIQICDQHFGTRATLAIGLRDELCSKGNALQALGKYHAAIKQYDRVISIDRGHTNALRFKGTTLQIQGLHEAAIDQYDKVLSIHPGYASVLSNKANSLHELGNFHEAIVVLRRLTQLKPRDANGWAMLGHQLSKHMGQHREAIKCYETALANDPEDVVYALNNMGNALQALGQYQEAIDQFDKVLSVDPEDVNALEAKAACQIQIDRIAPGSDQDGPGNDIDANDTFRSTVT